jgi:hypothetical protein
MVTITIPRSKFEADKSLQQSAEFQSQKEKIELYGKWVGLGKEVGDAVNGSLQAVTDQTAKFADTKVGKVTMALVIWKVVGDEFSGYLLGLLWLIVFLPLWVWSYRKTTQRVVRESEIIEGNKRTITYKPISYESEGDRQASQWVHLLVLAALIIAPACFFIA